MAAELAAEYNINIARSFKLLEKVIWINGKPENIRCDNGPEFISTKFKEWCKGNRINIIVYSGDVDPLSGFIVTP